MGWRDGNSGGSGVMQQPGFNPNQGGMRPGVFNGGHPNMGGMANAMPIKPLGMPGGTPGYVPANGAQPYGGASGMDQPGGGYSGNPYPPMPANGYPGGQAAWEASQDIIRSGKEAPPGFMFQPNIYGTGGLEPAMGRPTLDNPNPQSLGNGTGGPWDPRSSGANTGFQGTPSAGDIYSGKWGFQAGMSGPEKQAWLQNNAAPLTGHNYVPDLTDFHAQMRSRLDSNNAAALQKLKDNPAYALMQSGGRSTGADAANAHVGYANSPLNPANRNPNAGNERMAAAAAYQASLTPEMIQQQINNGQRAPTTNAQTQAMLANMSPAQRQAYIDGYAKLGINVGAGAPMQGGGIAGGAQAPFDPAYPFGRPLGS